MLAQLPIPGLRRELEKPASSVDPNYFELLERNSHIVYPVLGLMVLALVTVAILQATKAQDMDGAVKAEFKKLIVDELRRYPAGLETPDLAAATGLDRSKLVRLLDQMQQDGVLVSHTTTQRQTVWRVKGIGGRY
ncbi:hypothetical protein JQX13_02490 [Archangium violaceum]|nr:hypothetical protein JQX13_02490 [Archangium violaceum]